MAPTTAISDFHLSSLLHLNHILELQRFFFHDEQDDNEDEGDHHRTPDVQLSLSEFTHALQAVLGANAIPESQIARMFHRIDANSDGSVSWDEWCDFFLMFDQRHINLYRDTHASNFTPADGYSGRDVSATPTRQSLIVFILTVFVPMEQLKPAKWLYVTCTRNGVLSLWDPGSLLVLSTLRPESSATQWVTHLIALCIPDFVVLSTVDHTIQVIQLSTMEVILTLSSLPHAAVAMAAFRNADGEHMIAFGDMGGYLNLRTLDQRAWNSIALTTPARYHVHRDWITQVAYLAAYRYVITASMDSTVKFVNLADGTVQRQFARHRTGVYTFYFSPQLNLMASSGARNVYLWNPDQMDVLASLKGHTSPVHQMVIDERAYKLFTLSMDKVFKVWDCYTYQCMQTVVDPTQYFPDETIGRIVWDVRLQQLVSSTTRLRVWPIHTVLQSSTRTSHDCAITCASYTPALHQVATGDVNSAIHTWDVHTGELVMRIPRAHGAEQITVLTYDAAGKRVLSGAVDGTVNIWNGSNGQLLSRLHRTGDSTAAEISGILFIVPPVKAKSLNRDRYILVSGWDRHVIKYKDDKAIDMYPFGMYTESNQPGHNDDVVALCYIPAPSALVVSASVDGRLLVWSFILRTVRHRLVLSTSHVEYDKSFHINHASSSASVDFAECMIAFPSKDGFITGSAHGRVDFWCSEKGRIKQCILPPADEYGRPAPGITSLALTSSRGGGIDSILVVGTAAGELQLWDLAYVHRYYSTQPPPEHMPVQKDRRMTAVALVRQHQHATALRKWAAHTSDVVFLALANEMILSAGKDGVLTVWNQSGAQVGIFGHDNIVVPERAMEVAVTKQVAPSASPPRLHRGHAVKAHHQVQAATTKRVLPSDILKPKKPPTHTTLSPREQRLKNANQLAVHTVTEIPRKVGSFVHASLVDMTAEVFRRKDAACNL
ncbi:Aste57867_19855 [Aphanomyces stellatus]|uniref:Aste57867_19855 protein n=1 Tax=Aphanomyces stellatus TaxID=120398 RepID=A0A485LI73_9STRA|nr:hypothetical protein As57867_019789 [Aphanomyces stellatus]VFT96553.1 Aste57867_19855 [Aphanomyces stellatus]